MYNKYVCKICNFSTNSTYNYNRHNETKRHKDNITDNIKFITNEIKEMGYEINYNPKLEAYICNFCLSDFCKEHDLYCHLASCSALYKVKTQQQLNYNTTTNSLQLYNEKTKFQEEMIKMLNDEVVHLKSLLDDASCVFKKSMSALNYVNNYYSDAPLLQGLENMADIHKSVPPKEFAPKLVENFSKNKVVEYLGNGIILHYKKDDARVQSLWSSDSDRLTYIIRSIVGSNIEWQIDKKGILITQEIIIPILDYVDNCLSAFIISLDENIKKCKTKEIINRIDKSNKAGQIIQLIRSGELAESLLKYLAPHFFLKRSPQLLK